VALWILIFYCDRQTNCYKKTLGAPCASTISCARHCPSICAHLPGAHETNRKKRKPRELAGIKDSPGQGTLDTKAIQWRRLHCHFLCSRASVLRKVLSFQLRQSTDSYQLKLIMAGRRAVYYQKPHRKQSVLRRHQFSNFSWGAFYSYSRYSHVWRLYLYQHANPRRQLSILNTSLRFIRLVLGALFMPTGCHCVLISVGTYDTARIRV
jgi:hypothetical protein